MKKTYLTLIASFIAILTLTASPTLAATNYKDVKNTISAYEEITYLDKGNMLSSDSSTLFSPNASMTRAHAAVMIGKALQLSGNDKSQKYSDVSSSNFAIGYINEMSSRGIIKGYNNGTYLPNQTLTRGEMALLIARAFGYQSATTNDAANELINKGISTGVGKGNFGTTQLMKRGDFAVFLARAVNADYRTKTLTDTPVKMYVNSGNETLNFRSGPGTGYTTTHKFSNGYPVNVYYSVGDWVYAKSANRTGFFNKSYLTTDAPAAGSSPTEPIPVDTKKTFNNLVVVIDPGHGKQDPGATGFGVKEKDVVLDISLRMKKYFAQTPIKPMLTRETDTFLQLSQRAAFAKVNNADTFVSVHANALNGSAQGQETFYYASNNTNGDQSKALATYIHKRMQEAWNLKDRGIKYGNYHVLRENTVAAALVEVGFIDNKTDNAYIASPQRREEMARAIFLGILDYYYHYENFSEAGSYYSKFSATPSKKYY